MNARIPVEETSTKTTSRPSLFQAITSFSVWPSTSLGLLIFMSMFLALCEGCDEKVIYPNEWVVSIPFPEKIFVCGHYFYGIVLAISVLCLAVVRRPWAISAYSIWNCVLACACLVMTLVLTAMAESESAGGGAIARVLPFVLLVGWSAYYPLRNWDLIRLGTVLQNWIVFVCLLFLGYNVIFARALYLGFFVTLIALVLTIPASWLLYVRSSRDLINRNEPLIPFQISIRFLLLCMCLLPVLSFYFGWLQFIEGRGAGAQVEAVEAETSRQADTK